MFDTATQNYATCVLIWISLAVRQTVQFCSIAYLLATFKGRNAFINGDAFSPSLITKDEWAHNASIDISPGRAKRKCSKKPEI